MLWTTRPQEKVRGLNCPLVVHCTGAPRGPNSCVAEAPTDGEARRAARSPPDSPDVVRQDRPTTIPVPEPDRACSAEEDEMDCSACHRPLRNCPACNGGRAAEMLGMLTCEECRSTGLVCPDHGGHHGR